MRLELTRRTDYAIRTVICLGRDVTGEAIPAPRIAEAMGIPARFLAQVMQDLVRAGIVDARLGRDGGYRLARPLDELSMLDIIQAVEGEAATQRRRCVLRSASCDADRPCDVHAFFAAAQDALLAELAGPTVRDVLDQGPASGPPVARVPQSS
jgi:Rrf2 family protein